VAQIAGRGGVPVGECKAGCIVIEDSRSPGGHCMAGGALRRCRGEAGRDVIRDVPAHRGGAQEGRLVAAITIRRFEGVVVAHMAGGAGRRRRGNVRPR
jgi:hypothetical protein